MNDSIFQFMRSLAAKMITKVPTDKSFSVMVQDFVKDVFPNPVRLLLFYLGELVTILLV